MKWFWDNSSNINAIISIISTVISGTIFIAGLVISVLRLKLKSNQYKYLNLVVDSQTKQSMKCYVPTRAQNIDPCDEENNNFFSIELIPFFIKQVFKESDEQYFIVLADSGMGKTTFLLKLFFTYYKRILKKYDIIFIPLALKSSIEKIRKVKNKSNTILLLDGFDEDQYAIEDYVSRLKEICNETELFYKVVVTCRTQFFPDSESEPKNIGKIKFGIGKKTVEFNKYYVSPFNDKEINIYLKKKYNSFFEKKKITRAKKLIKNCPKLMVRPMLLSYLDDLLIDKKRKYKYAYEIYSELVSKWIEREAVENKLLFEFSDKVAEYMYLKKTVYISKDEIEELCVEYKIRIKSIEAKSRSLLNRNANGSYKFAHKSILEFFLARKAFNEIKFRERIVIENLSNFEMGKLFLGEMSYEYLKKCLKYKPNCLDTVSLNFLIFENVDFSMKKIINCDLEGCILSNANLSKIYFEKTNLQNADLSDADLSDADLSNVNLEGANLTRAKLMGANLQGTILTNVNFTGVDMRNANLSKTVLSYVDLTGANLEGANIEDICLREVKITGAKLDGNQTNYIKKKCSMREVNLE